MSTLSFVIMDENVSRTKIGLGLVKPKGRVIVENLEQALPKVRPSLRLGLGRKQSNDENSKSNVGLGPGLLSPRPSNKKALFKPWTESTSKNCRFDQGDEGIGDPPVTPITSRLNHTLNNGILKPSPEENSVALMGLISQHALDFDITPVKPSKHKQNLDLDHNRPRPLGRPRDSNTHHDIKFISATQAMKSHPYLTKSPDILGLGLVCENNSKSLEMLSHNESIFGAVNLEEVEKLYFSRTGSFCEPHISKQTNVYECQNSSTFLAMKADNEENSLGKKRKKESPANEPKDNDIAVGLGIVNNLDLPSELFTNETKITHSASCTNTQIIPPSIEPMGVKIRRALITNAQKPITPKPQIPPVTPTGTYVTPILNNNSKLFDLGPFFGLPSLVKTLIQQFKGIRELYPWQIECLHLPALMERRNLIYALPTSGGKTLVAEILILRELLCRKKNVIFVLPYVSIVQEKVRALSAFAVALNFLVEEYAAGKGMYPPRKRRWKQSVFVCTIEKALGLINSLIEVDRLSEVGLVVVDELHLIGDGSGRGANLEGLLTKVIFSLKSRIQIVGMSATIGNLTEIADFLNAETYTQDFRPVELTEYVKLENSLYKVNQNIGKDEELVTLVKSINYEYTPHMRQVDPDMLAGLVLEVIPTYSCLLFCATKQNCENVAILLSRLLPKDLLLEHKKTEKIALYKALLAQGNGSVCPVLSQTLPYGIAYHHSGLTGDERRLLEEAYLSSIICCICCTSTLAAGVNLPAKRVILRSPYIGLNFINLSRYKQMVGRAGRAGMGDSGESILMCTKNDVEKVKNLLESKMDESLSGLHLDESRGMRNLVLSAIGLGIATSRTAIHRLAKCTLLRVQAAKLETDVIKLADEAVENLFKLGAVRTEESAWDVSVLNNDISFEIASTCESSEVAPDVKIEIESERNEEKKKVVIQKDSELTISKLGRAAMKGSIELSRARLLYEDLRQAQSSFVCVSCLHLLYLVTPYDLAGQITLINDIYFRSLQDLNKKDMQTARILGLNEAAMTYLMRGKIIKGVQQRVVKRFYVTLMLNDLWAQKSTWEVAEKYQVSRGFIQSLMTSSSAFASCVMRFCEELDEMWCFKDLLSSFTQRLAHCCSLELIPLMELPSVKRGRAKQLYNAGYKTIMDVAKANPSVLVTEIEPLPRKIAFQIIAAAKMYLVEKVETLREEAADAIEALAVNNEIKF